MPRRYRPFGLLRYTERKRPAPKGERQMWRRHGRSRRALDVTIIVVGCLCTFLAAVEAEESSVFAGKTITITVGFGTGGSYDLYSRLLAPSLTKHIPGHPNV